MIIYKKNVDKCAPLNPISAEHEPTKPTDPVKASELNERIRVSCDITKLVQTHLKFLKNQEYLNLPAKEIELGLQRLHDFVVEAEKDLIQSDNVNEVEDASKKEAAEVKLSAFEMQMFNVGMMNSVENQKQTRNQDEKRKKGAAQLG